MNNSNPRLPTPEHPSFSFECFPPKTDKQEDILAESSVELAKLGPEYFSVTFGAGGSTRVGTGRTVRAIRERTGIEVAPHISCMGADPEEVLELIEEYRQDGVRRLVTLRGDRPSGTSSTLGKLRYASDLVEMIRKHTGDDFHIEVGCYPEFHPEAKNAEADLDSFRRKVEAGADVAITQYFFNPDAYFRFVYECDKLGIDIPIVPGIMPLTNYKMIARFSDACAAEIPRWIRQRLIAYDERDDKESLKQFGVEVVTDLCAKLLEGGAPGLHFYTLNRSWATTRIWNNLGLPHADEVREKAEGAA